MPPCMLLEIIIMPLSNIMLIFNDFTKLNIICTKICLLVVVNNKVSISHNTRSSICNLKAS